MEKKTKNIIIASSVLLLGGLAVYIMFRKPKDRPDKNGDDSSDDNGNNGSGVDSRVGGTATVADGYANTREGSCTDTDIVVKAQGTGTIIGNILDVKKGCNDASGQKDWYYVKLTPDLEDESSIWGGFGEHTHAWVREDVADVS